MIGQRIGSYCILRQLGSGGMGTVYEAVHEQIGRRAAIKVLHPELSKDRQATARFFNEARAVNIVTHPGIVDIFEFGQLADGTLYVVMEYLFGETMASRLRRVGAGATPDLLRLFRQVASAVAIAHQRGIVHRDLKPDNIMIVPDAEIPGGERVKVLDFGIAKLAEEHCAPRGSDQVTRTGMLLGTPTYMAPEQCRGVAVDGQADVYALGVMLYQMITGRPPFVAETLGEVLAMHILTPPQPIESLGWEISPALTQLLNVMLSKAPSERPTMGQVAMKLEALAAGEPMPAVNNESTRCGSAWWERATAFQAGSPSTCVGRQSPAQLAPPPPPPPPAQPASAARAGSIALLVAFAVGFLTACGGLAFTALAKDRPQVAIESAVAVSASRGTTPGATESRLCSNPTEAGQRHE